MDPDVNVQVLWQDARSALASIRPLGEYRIEMKGKPSQRMDMTLSTLNGALKMQGQGSMVPGSRMNFTGEAWSDANNKAALTGLLSQMGRLEGERYKLGVF
jgi:general secretion pathway protein N